MIYEKATKRIEKNKIGFSETYPLENEEFELSREVLYGGYETISGTNQSKLIYVLRGTGDGEFIKKDNLKNISLKEGVSVNVPSGQSFKLNDGQLDYLLLKTKESNSIKTQDVLSEDILEVAELKLKREKVSISTNEETKLIYILDGAGFGKICNKGTHLRKGSFIELLPNTTLEMNGTLEYLMFTKNK